MPTNRIEEMNWPDIEAAIAQGKTTIIIPIASIEQHGPHLPLITDTLLGEAIGDGIAAALGDALVAPVIRPGYSDHHLAFTGSLSIPEPLLAATIEAYCRCLSLYGFRHIVLLPTHGGNFGPVAKVAEQLQAGYAEKGIQIITLADLDELMEALAEPLYPYGYTFAQVGAHAGAAETALVLALRPDLVRPERAEPGYLGPLDAPRLFREGFRSVTATGVIGDPCGVTAGMGREILCCIVERYTAKIRAIRDQ